MLVARVPPERRFEVGADVRVSASPRRVYLFDADSGATLRGLKR
jgi:hypothetical protein